MLGILQEAVNIPGYQKVPDVEIKFSSPNKDKSNIPHPKKQKKFEEEEEEDEVEITEKEEEVIFTNEDNIKGQVFIYQNSTSIFKYKSISIELLANIHTTKTNEYNFEFIHISSLLDNAGEVNCDKKFGFDFGTISTIMETFKGELLTIEYKIKVIFTQMIFGFTSESEKTFIYRYIPSFISNNNNKNNKNKLLNIPIKHNLVYINNNVNNCLDIFFELSKNKFFIDEPITGKLVCGKIQLYIRSVELMLIRNEKLKDKICETVIARYEMCDGLPFDGEALPIRFYFDESAVSQSMKNINNGICWIKYFVKIVVHVDDVEENNNLYKTQEIIFYRNKI